MDKKKILYGCIILILLAQFIQPVKENPKVRAEIVVNAKLKQIFERSCYDCHSNETDWPWYASVSPINYLVTSDVNEGRRHLNFSDWESYENRRMIRKLSEIKEEIEEGEMPMGLYLFFHQSAELAQADKELIFEWIEDKIDSLEKKN